MMKVSRTSLNLIKRDIGRRRFMGWLAGSPLLAPGRSRMTAVVLKGRIDRFVS